MSECGCVYSGYDGVGAEFCHIDRVRARKIHRCGECHQTIQPVAMYERVAGKFDGDFATERTCITCVEIRDLLFCDGFNYGAVWEDIREYFREGGKPFGCIDKLTSPAAKEKLAAEYRDFLGLKASAAQPAPQEGAEQ